jgi:hypothetical protein
VSCFLCCWAAVEALRAADGGRIVNVAACPVLEPRTGASMTAYTALVQVLRQCGGDFSRDNIMRQATSLHDLEIPVLVLIDQTGGGPIGFPGAP